MVFQIFVKNSPLEKKSMKPAWSYSAIKTFGECPLQYRLRTTKQVVDKETEELRWGNVVHKALENRVVDGKPLPDSLVHLEPVASKIAEQEGKFGERRLAIDDQFKPVKFFDQDVWCRGIVDVGVCKGSRIWAGDWKTGKRRPGSDQLQLSAALLFHNEPNIIEIKVSYIWIKEAGKTDTETFHRNDLKKIWGHFLPKVAKLEAAYDQDKWPAKPSGLCPWCPATKSQCEFSRRDEEAA